MAKEIKTNAMRFLERNKVDFRVNTYECSEFVDGVQMAHDLNQPVEISYKTLVTEGSSKRYYVFVIPVAEELDLKKAAKAVGEKSVEMIPVRDINQITGYIRGGCSPLGMKKQFPTIVEAKAEVLPMIIISGGRLGSQIEITPKDLVRVIGGRFDSVTYMTPED